MAWGRDPRTWKSHTPEAVKHEPFAHEGLWNLNLTEGPLLRGQHMQRRAWGAEGWVHHTAVPGTGTQRRAG